MHTKCPECNLVFTPENHDDEIKILRAENARYRKALEFYANQNSWFDFLSNYTTINAIQDDDLYEDKDEHGQFLVGGRRAREALKEIRG